MSSPTASTSTSKARHHLASGALSGLTSAICLQPLDLLKTRVQQGNDVDGVPRRRITPILKQILREEGPAGLWRGTIPTVVRNVPGVALYFYTLSSLRTRLSQIHYFSVLAQPSHSTSGKSTTLLKLSSQGNLIAGAVARTSVGFVLNPITVLKARYESNLYPTYHSLPKAFVALLRTNGIKGLFQGVTATAARDAPYAGLYVVFYEKGKDFAGRLIRPEWGVPNAALHSGSAIAASTLATLVTSPADCVKTRMQVTPLTHPTIRKAINRIYSDRGFLGFFSGSSLRISRKAASSAIAWSVYEGVLLFFNERSLVSSASAR
ncbi:solute carrier family 25, member 38, partial [Tremellales sp. Uapishka_1]